MMSSLSNDSTRTRSKTWAAAKRLKEGEWMIDIYTSKKRRHIHTHLGFSRRHPLAVFTLLHRELKSQPVVSDKLLIDGGEQDAI
jgi:hypothetical protein